MDRSSDPKRVLQMPLAEIPQFAGLPDAAKAELRSTCTLPEYRASDVILQPGELGTSLYAIAMGAVSVRPTSGLREFSIVLGPGDVFGEMSLLSGARVSAAVVTERETRVYLVIARIFDRLFADEPAFRKGIVDLLAERLRLRTSHKDSAPTCVLIGTVIGERYAQCWCGPLITMHP